MSLRCLLLLIAARWSSCAPRTSENERWNVNFETRHSPNDYYGEWPGHTYHPSPPDWRALSIYQLLTDRFADGDPRNNELFAEGFDVRDMTYRHGGDFVGLTKKLPYIKGLGCQAIWISPVFQNGDNMYHQYAQQDFTVLDKRLGTLEELRNLTTAAHQLGMYVIVDVVMNHMANEFYFEGRQYSPEGAPFRFHGDGSEREYQLVPRRLESELHDTPAGKQPYVDFWYNNTWDPEAQYEGRVYGQWGESAGDDGYGTYPGSDFHHNGDLKDYFKPWEINIGKIYGTMDDLRLESARVQEKYIAMTKALIASTDVDGFRVDTPMQVPLNFFKAWAPAVREFAKSLGKERFGMFGEFYVTPARYATMTGRGRDNTMYGQETFIEGPATLKGGIVYSYYWYTFTAMVHERPELSDGLPLAYRSEAGMLDILDPSTNRSEYSMWNFCNNHDNWRMQAMTGTAQMRMCLAVITFWPGVPLHYAGDEQDLNTPGSALDGWAREELGVSMAWRAVRTTPEGNPADRDNFDMTAPSYRYIQRLNSLRRAYFGSFGREQCDVVETPAEEIPDVLVFTRGCTDESRVTLIANFHTRLEKSASVVTPWAQGTRLFDVVAAEHAVVLEVGSGGLVQVTLPPLGVLVLAPGGVKAIPPAVVEVTPKHGASIALAADGEVNISVLFDRPMTASVAALARLDGRGPGFRCASAACDEIVATVAAGDLSEGFHTIEVEEGADAQDGESSFSAFHSTFLVATRPTAISDPTMHAQPGLICGGMTELCHNAAGADAFRVQNVGEAWSDWQPYQARSQWATNLGTAVLVQYHAHGSSSYIVGDCIGVDGRHCHSSWHPTMFMRGDWNDWGFGSSGEMHLVEDFTWGLQITTTGFAKAKFAPFEGWSKAYGVHADRELLYNLPDYDPRHTTFDVQPYMSGSEASRRWMAQRQLWSEHESIASGAEFAKELWVSSSCTAEAPRCPVPDNGDWQCVGFTRPEQNMSWCRAQGVVGCTEYAENDFSPNMTSCGPCTCCRRKVTPDLSGPQQTCCVLFNDMLLNYTITPDLSRCTSSDQSSGSNAVPIAAPLTCPPSPPAYVATDPKVQETIEWSQARLQEAESLFKDRDLHRTPSPDSWHTEVVYSVLVDRFANGDIKNDRANIPDFQRDELEQGLARSLYKWRHGGDLQGLKGRLTYLRDLGVTALSLSPIFTNGRGEYHGYCTSDPTSVDPGFGSADLLQGLVQEAHALGLRVVLEVQVNHACGRDLKYSSTPTVEEVGRCVADYEDAYWNTTRGEALLETDRSELSWGGDLHEALRHPAFFTRCGPRGLFRPAGEAFSHLDEEHDVMQQAGKLWTDSPDSGGLDFNTLDVGFQTVYANMLKWWVAFADIDGLRVTAGDQTSADFTAFLATQTRHYANVLGKDNFILVGGLDLTTTPFGLQQLGNVASSGQRLPQRLQGALDDTCELYQDLNPPWPGLLATDQAPEAGGMRAVAAGTDQPASFVGNGNLATSAREARTVLASHADLQSTWTSLESSSAPRLLSKLAGDATAEAWRIQVGLVWSFTWYGVPMLYSGIEMGFNGLCFNSTEDRGRMEAELLAHGHSVEEAAHLLGACDYTKHGERVDAGFWRQDFFWGGPLRLGSAVASVQAQRHIGRTLMGASGPHWCEDPLVDRSNDIYQLTRALIRIRRSCPALRAVSDEPAELVDGSSEEVAYWKYADSDTAAGGRLAMLVVLKFNRAPDTSALEFMLPEGLEYEEEQEFVDLLHPSRTARVVQKADSKTLLVPVDLPEGHTAIFAPKGEVIADDPGFWLVCASGAASLPPLRAQATDCESEDARLVLTWGGFSFALAVVFLVFLCNWRSSIYLSVVKEATPPTGPPTRSGARMEPQHVLTAAIEHTIPERGVKVSAGGLGKVLDQMLREHPEGTLSLVHPMFGDVDYGELEDYKELQVVVDGKPQTVVVYRIASELNGIQRNWYLLSHELFRERSRKAPYPSPMTKLRVLRYFSLWNQAVAALLQDLQPDVYHCMDYHAALAPLYLPKERRVPVILVLHNADYMGIVETDFINNRFWQTVPELRRLGVVFNLKRCAIRKYLTFEGRFNMLKAGVTYIKEAQRGHGICAVSANYGAELKRERALFNGVPSLMALDNATDPAEDQGKASVDVLQKQRFQAKAALQAHCGLEENPEAKILIFIGRWVKQKGVDHIAMITPCLLRSHPEVQIVLAGPPDDACGLYAEELLAPIAPQFPGRLFVCTEFFALPAELRRGAHLCFAPSCSEPFGYVDVEFGLLGVPSVGCAIGGLGKMPGVYFRQQNADSSQMLLDAFLCSVDYALSMPDAEYWEMAQAATKATFPFDTWRDNLMDAYSQAMTHFKPRRAEELTLWHSGPEAETIRSEMSHRKQNRFRPKSSASIVAQQMQVLDIDDDREFLTQTVSEQRVHDIMKEAMANDAKRGKGKVKDGETLQRNICLAEQRLTEKNHVTQWLMKPFARSKYLRIHAVIALCYIISPAGDTLLKSIEAAGAHVSFTDDTWHVIFYSGVAAGSLLWLGLSRAVPPNLLMASSQLTGLLFSVLVPSLPEGLFASDVAMATFLSLNGVLSASRLLFIIWNFNEDFHGGFQVACKRIGALESLRTAAGMLSVICSYGGMELLYRQVVFLVSLGTLVLLFKAPRCYCAYSLPFTGYLEGLYEHKSFWLLLASEMLNQSTSYAAQTYHDWWALNGWSSSDIINFSLIIMLISALLLPAIFGMLTKMSVWGPWAMRDFSCLLPPGALLRALALYDIGHLHYRSYLFSAALVASYCIDVVRGASIFASIMAILGNKWYALKGCYVVIFLTAVCSSLSPYIGHAIAMAAVGASPFDRVTLDKPASGAVGSLGDAVLWAVGPLAAASYLLQLATLWFFNGDILTFKGHGNVLPDGSRTGTAATTRRVSVSTLKRIRRAAGSAQTGCIASTAGAQDKISEGTKQKSDGDCIEEGSQFSEVAGSQLFRRVPSNSAASSRAPSRVGSMVGSMACSENVSEIEQQILFNLVERSGSASLPGLSPSNASRVGPGAISLGGEEDLRSHASTAKRREAAVVRLLAAHAPPPALRCAASEASAYLSEASEESDASEDSQSTTCDVEASAAAAAAAPEAGGSREEGSPPDAAALKLGGICSI